MSKWMGLLALGIMGWIAKCLMDTMEKTTLAHETTTAELSRTFTESTARITQAQVDLTLTLMAGYPPSSEQSLTITNENETLSEQEMTLEGMPDHIRQAYEREATEDQERLLMLSSMPPGDLA